MKLAVTVLVLAGALAGLFVTASRSPGTAQTVERRLVVVNFTGTDCSPTPVFNAVCGSHEQAERLRAGSAGKA